MLSASSRSSSCSRCCLLAASLVALAATLMSGCGGDSVGTTAFSQAVTIADLLQTLDALGIDPLGSEFVDNTVWVHAKEVDPYAVAEAVSEVV